MSSEETLKSLAKKTDAHEFFTPIPEGYKSGKTKYILITGTVISGLGKGILSSSLAKLLKDKGLKVAPIKLEGYLNVDSGTLNPYRHGEVFVLDDGLECDMDLGTYERLLEQNLGKQNYVTNGQILHNVLNMERKGKYLGRDVQFIPHVTGEVKLRLRQLAHDTKADVVLVEIGGTIGDLENAHYIEAIRELAYEEGPTNTCFITLTYIVEPIALGEQKSKAAQLGIRSLISTGIQPHIVACRSHNKVTEKIREKISIYSNVELKRVIGLHDKDSVYEIPLNLSEVGLDKEVIYILNLNDKVDNKQGNAKLKEWRSFIDKVKKPKRKITIGITGKYTSLRDSYASILKAIEHAGAHSEAEINVKWIETTNIEKGKKSVSKELKGVKGIIVPGGFGKRGSEGKIACIKYAREKNIPYLGLCLGFQMALIEFARNVCNIKEANSTELEPNCKDPVIDILPEQKKIEGLGGNMRLGGRDILVKKDTQVYKLYSKQTKVRERFRHRYECNPEYIKVLEEHGMVFSGRAPKYPIMQILELPTNKFHIGTQFHPEFTSRPLIPNPLFRGFIEAALDTK